MKISEKKLSWLMTAFLLFGIGVIYVSVEYIENRFLSYLGILIGGVCTCIAGYSAEARIAKIKPFDDAYKKSRESYKDDCQDNAKK